FLDARWLAMTEQTLTLELVDSLTPTLPAGWRCSRAEALTLIFSAKESLFKALYPRVGRYFDFLDARWLAMTEQTLTLELVDSLTPTLPAGWRCTLYWQPMYWQALHWQTGHWQTRPGGVLTSLLL
ncbi:4'-phosphopantetheinyl transferase superfamily protein, partial [Aeromonas dhakensis]